ncbi:MAG: hypothetical protein MK098_12515 [Marinovum sp.]|nr:hypothetical protein [Marinovum sp.]
MSDLRTHLGDMMFACFNAGDPGVSVQTSSIETTPMRINAGVGRKARSVHHSWTNRPDGVASDALEHHIVASCDQVRTGLAMKIQASPAAREG